MPKMHEFFPNNNEEKDVNMERLAMFANPMKATAAPAAPNPVKVVAIPKSKVCPHCKQKKFFSEFERAKMQVKHSKIGWWHCRTS